MKTLIKHIQTVNAVIALAGIGLSYFYADFQFMLSFILSMNSALLGLMTVTIIKDQ